MSSQKQIDANRLNAQKSTGPNTPEGRDAVRFNALRHGLTAKHAVLENENEQEFQEMLDAFEAEHQPTGLPENLLVQQMVMALAPSASCAPLRPACSISACVTSPSKHKAPTSNCQMPSVRPSYSLT